MRPSPARDERERRRVKRADDDGIGPTISGPESRDAPRAPDHARPCHGAIEFIEKRQAALVEVDRAHGVRNGLRPANLARHGVNGVGRRWCFLFEAASQVGQW